MEISDYNTRLAQTRNRYNEASQELKDNYNERVEDLEKLHDSKVKNQRETYLNQKNTMEEGAQERLERYDSNLKKALAERTERYNKNIEEKRKDFDHNRQKQMNDYNQKLSSISKSFDTANTEKDKLHAMYKDNIQERYEEGLSKRESQFNEKLGIQQNTAMDKLNQFRDQQNREKIEMITDHTNQKKQLVQDANISRNSANSRHQLDMERLRENAKQNENTQRNNFENANASLRKTKSEESEGQRITFEKLTNQIQDRNESEMQRLNRQNKTDKRDLENTFAKDRIQLERRTNSLLNEGSHNKVETSRKALQAQHENQLGNLKKSIEENTYNNNLLNERLSRTHSGEIKNLEIFQNTELDKKNNEMRKLRQEEVGGLRDQFGSYQELMGKRNKNLERENEEQTVAARQKLVNTVARQRAEFGRTLNHINMSNQEAMADARVEMSEEQTKFIESTKRNVHNEMEDLKSDLNDVFARKEDSLQKKIEMSEKEQVALEDKYQKKLDTLQAKSAKELEQLKVFESERRKEDRRAAERQLDQQQREFQKTLMSLRREYDSRLDKTKANNDLHIAKLTERYENQISRERQESNAASQRAASMANANYNRLVDKTNMEKDTLINQYEVKISKLREGNRLANEIKNTRPKDA
ncbi:MAG: hypothetical protein K9K67_14440 [Bacteriovoracaceae bacterium]|nr:hypothetical protein [Bacteriovoracaceae bacterium]